MMLSAVVSGMLLPPVVAARQVRDPALEARLPAVVVAVAALVADGDGVLVAVEDDVQLVPGQLAHRHVQAEAVPAGDALQLAGGPAADRRRARPGEDGALGAEQGPVG